MPIHGFCEKEASYCNVIMLCAAIRWMGPLNIKSVFPLIGSWSMTLISSFLPFAEDSSLQESPPPVCITAVHAGGKSIFSRLWQDPSYYSTYFLNPFNVLPNFIEGGDSSWKNEEPIRNDDSQHFQYSIEWAMVLFIDWLIPVKACEEFIWSLKVVDFLWTVLALVSC